MEELRIERLGQRGEGIARTAKGPVYVPYALVGEIVLAEVAGERGLLVESFSQALTASRPSAPITAFAAAAPCRPSRPPPMPIGSAGFCSMPCATPGFRCSIQIPLWSVRLSTRTAWAPSRDLSRAFRGQRSGESRFHAGAGA